MDIIQALITAYVTVSTICFTLFLLGLIRNIRNVLDEKKGTDVLNKMRIVYIEQVGGAVYMYDKLTNSFLLQAPTEAELWTKAETQYPGLKFFTTTKEADFSKDEE